MAAIAMNDKGFVRPGYAQLLAAAEARAKALFGEELCTGGQTAFGKFLRLWVHDLAALYEELEEVYLGRFPHHAEGVNLDRLTPFAGVHRANAQSAVMELTCYGTPGTRLEKGLLLGTAKGLCFATVDACEIGPEGQCVQQTLCLEEGVLGNVSPENVCVIMSPTAGLDRVKGLRRVRDGRERESDQELRERFDLAVRGMGSGTPEAIRAAVLRVDGVQSCEVRENPGDLTDQNGLPPHSFACYVLGAAADSEVAAAIFAKKPIGIKSVGSCEVEVPAGEGKTQTVCFCRVAEKPLKARVSLRVKTTFPADGAAQVAEKLAGFTQKLAAGERLVYTALYPEMYAVAGVQEVNGLWLSDDGGERFVQGNLDAGSDEALRLLAEDVEVEVVRV